MRLRAFADASLARHPGAEVGLGEFGKIFKALRAEGCEVVCFAGNVSRPDFSALMPDARGLKVLPGLIVAAPIIGMVALLIRKLLAGEKLFGDAKWATPEEVQQAGLLGVRGIIVGKYKGRYLMFDGQQFVLLYAPTRSGKGVSCVVPNCLNWPDSLVALDIKPELWRLTSGFRRKHGQECYQFSPLSPNTHGWNPLHYISEDRHRRITDIQQIANMLCPDRQGVDPIWTATPRKLFLGVVLYLLETPGVPVTLGEVLRQLSTAEDTAS